MPRSFHAQSKEGRRNEAVIVTPLGQLPGKAARLVVAKHRNMRRRNSARLGFTYAESMIALAVLSLTCVALLTSVAGAVNSGNDSVYRTVGQGLAEQLMDEIAAAKFPTGTVTISSTDPFRSSFTTIDDYASWNESPPRTKSGEVLGADDGATAAVAYSNMMSGTSSRAAALQAAPGFVNRFTRSVLVERVQPGSSGWTVTSTSTAYRRVTVTVSYTASNQPARNVAQLIRVFSSVSPAP